MEHTSDRPSGQMERLIDLLKPLSGEPSKLALLLQMAEGLQRPFKYIPNPSSNLATHPFVEYFQNRLLVHHAIADEKLNKLAFEYILQGALVAAGYNALLTKGRTVPGADVVIADSNNNDSANLIKFSLKTEGAEKAKADAITISKLMEARWMRGRDSFGLTEDIKDHILPHLNRYDRILTLRSFDTKLDDEPAIRYDLVEIPADLLRRVDSVIPENIIIDETEEAIKKPGAKSKKKKQTYKVPITDAKGEFAFNLVFDGSVEKISIKNLGFSDTGPAVVHASWIVTVPDVVRYHVEKGAVSSRSSRQANKGTSTSS